MEHIGLGKTKEGNLETREDLASEWHWEGATVTRKNKKKKNKKTKTKTVNLTTNHIDMTPLSISKLPLHNLQVFFPCFLNEWKMERGRTD
jgi:hypothetical protein